MQFLTEFSKQVWETKYRAHDSAAVFDKTIEDTWRRSGACDFPATVEFGLRWEGALESRKAFINYSLKLYKVDAGFS